MQHKPIVLCEIRGTMCLFQREDPDAGTRRRIRKELNMLNLISRARETIARRSHYSRLANEINDLTLRDLADINGDRTDMLRAAYRHVYGR